MTTEEAIEQLKLLKPFLEYEDTNLSKRIAEALDMAISELDKKVLKKPIDDPDYWKCPCCKSPIHHEQQIMYCRHCGQLVTWA